MKKEKKKRVYISGPMTDQKTGEVVAENQEMFWKAEELLNKAGYEDTVNPVRVWACKFPWLYRLVGYRLTLLYDIWLLMRCTHIYKLPRWQQSRGANIESCVAYHLKILPVKQKVIDAINKKLENIIKNNEKRKGNG